MTRQQWIFLIIGAVLILAVSCCVSAAMTVNWVYATDPGIDRIPTAEPYGGQNERQ